MFLAILYTVLVLLKETRSVTINIFRFFFLFKSFVKKELSYVFTINMFSTAENCMGSELFYKKQFFFYVPPIILDS